MIPVEEAVGRLEAATGALASVEVSLEEAHGRVLAETVVADRDFPPLDRSAMDGYAVRAADVPRPGCELELAGEVRAGQPVGDLTVGPGQAVRIMTGATVPPGADAVVMVEKTEERTAEGRVRIDDAPRPGRHVRRRGEDRERGAVVVERGAPIHAAEIAALAALGRTSVRVHRVPDVRVLSTGDEVVEPDRVPGVHQVRNSNAHTLLAQLAELGIRGRYLGIAGDDRGALDRRLAEGLRGDLLLVTGGVSVGNYDLVAESLAAAGMRRILYKVAVKPGKPLLAGRRGECLVLGLPGNPVSTFTCFFLFAAPVLRRMLGYRRWRNRPQRASLVEPLEAAPGRETYHLARLETGPGGLAATAIRSAGSGDVLGLARANGFVVTPAEGASLAAGAEIPALPWRDSDFR